VVKEDGTISGPPDSVAAAAAAETSQATGTSGLQTSLVADLAAAAADANEIEIGGGGGAAEVASFAAARGFARVWDLEGVFEHKAHLLMVEVQQLVCRGVPGDSPLVKDLVKSIRSAFSVCVGATADVARLREQQQQVVQQVQQGLEWGQVIAEFAPAAEDRVWREVVREEQLLCMGAAAAREIMEQLLQPPQGQGAGAGAAAAAGGGGAAGAGAGEAAAHIAGVNDGNAGAARAAVTRRVAFKQSSSLQSSVMLLVLNVLRVEHKQQQQEEEQQDEQHWHGIKSALLSMLHAGAHCSFNPVFNSSNSLLAVVLEPLLVLADQIIRVLLLPANQQQGVLDALTSLRIGSAVDEWVGFCNEGSRMLLSWSSVDSAAAAEAAFPCVVQKGDCWCPVCLVFLVEEATQRCRDVMEQR
jgi:hypothetical protein